MKKLIVVLFLTFNLFGEFEAFEFDNVDKIFKIKGVVEDSIKNLFINKLASYKHKEMYIYIESPGGSVPAMFDIIDAMKTSKVEFVCFAKFAASAAFNIFQHCTTRVMLRNATLMAHPASISIQGKIDTIINLLKVIKRQVDRLNSDIAERLGMSFLEYDYKISKDWWFDIKEAIDYNAIDYVNHNISCSKELKNKKLNYEVTKYSVFGPFKMNVEEPACPLMEQQ